MVEINVVIESFGAMVKGDGGFALGLLPEQYKDLEVVKIPDGTENFWVSYQNLRFTVSSNAAETLLKLGATQKQNLTC